MAENYVGYSPWTDAANYGEGLGQSLSQAFLQMPQQRYEMALQAAQMQARQQALGAQMQRQALMEKQNEALRQVQMQEALARTAAAQAAIGREQQQPNKWVVSETKAGVPLLVNQSTGEHKIVDLPKGLGATPNVQANLQAGQQRDAASGLGSVSRMIGGFLNPANTNAMQLAPSVYNQATNAFPALLQKVLGGTNAPSTTPQFNLTAPPATNVLKYNPLTGQIE